MSRKEIMGSMSLFDIPSREDIETFGIARKNIAVASRNSMRAK
jgi:hypothetical protein